MNIKYSKTDKPKFDLLLNSIIDYIFWSLLIIFTNPGGMIQALNIYYISGKVNYGDVAFVLLSICYFIIPKTHTFSDLAFLKVKKCLIVFTIYYYLFYVIIIPNINNTGNYSLIFCLTKTRHTFYNIALFLYIYEFFKRRWDIFLKIFLFSSILILGLFVSGGITGSNILPVDKLNRGFVDIDRNLMISEGIMPLLIPLGIVIIVFKIKTKYRYLIIFGFILMSAAYLFELWRRNIISVFIYFALAIIIDAFIKHNMQRLLSNTLKALLLLFFLTISLYLTIPKYTKAAHIALIETISVIKYSKTTGGDSDIRLNLNRPFINNLFYKSPVWGTGFDNRWRNHEGDVQGYEAADYPLMASLAMFGITGIIIFLPIYIVLIQIIKSDLQYYRNNTAINNIMRLISMSLLLFFIYHLLQYFNYFIFISVSDDFIYYFFLSLYLASRALCYKYDISPSKYLITFKGKNIYSGHKVSIHGIQETG